MLQYPSLKDEKIVSIDIETYDPKLKTHGAGVYRDDGHILGVSIATGSGFNQYFQLGHKDTLSEIKNKNYMYLKENLAYSNDKVGANIMYDLDWLMNSPTYDIKVGGKIHDIQIAEPLLNEYARSYSFETLSQKYLGTGKEGNKCQEFCNRHGLIGDFRQHLYLMPGGVVEDYAKADSLKPIAIIQKQLELLKADNLYEVYVMETGLIPLLLQMKKNGIRIDVAKAYKTKYELTKKYNVLEEVFHRAYGNVNYNSTAQLKRLFSAFGIPVEYTAKGNASIDQHLLKKYREKYQLCADILELKKLEFLLVKEQLRYLMKGVLYILCHFRLMK
jgi:DNA polymerase I-like protein with 3'-5' exonuclease and polymerase domains